MNDAVWSYHLNPMTCGVARFNHQLAARLDIPCEAIYAERGRTPLVSIKPSEIGAEGYLWPYQDITYDLFLHSFEPTPRTVTWTSHARRVYAANDLIAQDIQTYVYRDPIVAWCPSLVQGAKVHGAFRVLMFGMAHKRQVPLLQRLKALLERSHLDYTVEVSTGIHEGSPWDRSWQETRDTLAGVFGPRLRLLGYLADDALVSAMGQAHLAALFYEDGVRANNTTLWAAMDSGLPVMTNLDAASPLELEHGATVLDLQHTRSITSYNLGAIAQQGQQAARARSWPRLLSVLLS